MTPIIPPELCDEIINFLHNDIRTLCNCSLVCRSWLLASRTHIFYRSIDLNPESINCILPLLLDPHSTILPHVRSLAIYDGGNRPQDEHRPAWVSDKLPQFPPFSNLQELNLQLIIWDALSPASKDYICSLLCRLTTLYIHRMEFESFDDFARILSSARSLKHLSLSSISCTRNDLSFRDLPVPPSLQTLRTSIGSDNPTLQWLSCFHSPFLHTLDVDLIGVEDVPILCNFLLSSSECLEHLVLSFITWHGSQYTFCRQANLSLNKSLKTITFCSLVLYRDSPGSRDFRWISDILSQITVCSLERVGLIVYITTPDELQPIVTGLSEVIEGENAMFMKQSTKLRFNVYGGADRAAARAWIEHNLYGLNERGQLEFV